MTRDHTQPMDLDGDEIEVAYTVHDYGTPESGMSGPPEDYDPGSGPEIEVTSATLDGVLLLLTDDQRQELEVEIADNPDWWMPDAYDGFDG